MQGQTHAVVCNYSSVLTRETESFASSKGLRGEPMRMKSVGILLLTSYAKFGPEGSGIRFYCAFLHNQLKALKIL